jgi:Zn-dependent M28 family amino/carboxypeptidase
MLRNLFFACFFLASFNVSAQNQLDKKTLIKDIEYLSSDKLEGRLVGTEGSAQAREYILKRFEKLNLEKFNGSFIQDFEFENKRTGESVKGANVIGYIKGKKRPDEYIVISAHYDHLGNHDGRIFNGADDNASGTSAALAIAANLKKNAPEHSVIFAIVDAEEVGHQGSKYFVKNLPVDKNKIRLNINMDMLSRSVKNELWIAGTSYSPFLKEHLEKVNKSSDLIIRLGHDKPGVKEEQDWTFSSDHAAFHLAGIPFLYFGVEDHPDYHKDTDEFKNIDQKFYIKAVEFVLAAFEQLDKNL